VKAAAKGEIPTLVKYADAAPYLVETSTELENREPKTGNGMSRRGHGGGALAPYTLGSKKMSDFQ